MLPLKSLPVRFRQQTHERNSPSLLQGKPDLPYALLILLKLPSWSFSLEESSFWIFILLGQIWRDGSHFLSSLFSFFPIPSFFFFFSSSFIFFLMRNDDFSVFCYVQFNASNKIMFCLLGWCYKIFRNITACYKSSIIKNYLLFIQNNKYKLSVLFLTLSKYFYPSFFLSFRHRLWDHSSSHYP